ncbi:hypothetical protein CERZMDRAFT_102651 [Cercospora zeae-maydis SCOH1-5]|uniref:Uncharacterized protein n=1 Tax=Cercospora zeae-maydis SCOH1-5 TaxID=717836 RepID=A0A6A6EZN6_9PEZI|nr:hypothetical protein CERZMDRAFT_102651 [Cercospora zeae-maydis SCOH1-5]
MEEEDSLFVPWTQITTPTLKLIYPFQDMQASSAQSPRLAHPYPANAPPEVHRHDRRCRPMVRFFDECTVAKTVDVHFRNGASLRDWNRFWETERARWDEETLVYIHFNGRAWGNNETYTWKVPVLGRVNAYKFMNELNHTDTDIVYLLDCWINTRFACFRRKHAMTEFILAGQPEPVPGFLRERLRNPGFIQRILQDCLRDPALAFQLEALLPLQSTPQLMSRDKILSNNPLRIRDLKPSTASAEKNMEIWRIPKPERPENETPEPADEEMEDVAPWEGQDEDHDEGFVSDEEEEAQPSVDATRPTMRVMRTMRAMAVMRTSQQMAEPLLEVAMGREVSQRIKSTSTCQMTKISSRTFDARLDASQSMRLAVRGSATGSNCTRSSTVAGHQNHRTSGGNGAADVQDHQGREREEPLENSSVGIVKEIGSRSSASLELPTIICFSKASFSRSPSKRPPSKRRDL